MSVKPRALRLRRLASQKAARPPTRKVRERDLVKWFEHPTLARLVGLSLSFGCVVAVEADRCLRSSHGLNIHTLALAHSLCSRKCFVLISKISQK